MIILVDVDGTIFTHGAFPERGKDIGAARVLKRMTDEGHQIVLWTCRSGPGLAEAISWYKENDIPLYGINSTPGQSEWSSSNKAYGHIIIDDTTFGAPLKYDPDISSQPFIDWNIVEQIFFDEWSHLGEKSLKEDIWNGYKIFTAQTQERVDKETSMLREQKEQREAIRKEFDSKYGWCQRYCASPDQFRELRIAVKEGDQDTINEIVEYCQKTKSDSKFMQELCIDLMDPIKKGENNG